MSISTAAAESNLVSASCERCALFDRASHLRLWPVAVLGVGVDLWSKSLAFERLSTAEPLVLIPGVFSLRRVVNPGAMLGLGQGWGTLFVVASVLALLFVLYLFAQSAAKRRSLHIGLGLVLAGAMGNLYDRTVHAADVIWGPPDPKSFHLFQGDRAIICGKLVREEPGAWVIGAYPDSSEPHQRIAKSADWYIQRTPVVRDFLKIDLRVGNVDLWRWVFNVADVLLVIGVGLLLLNFWMEHRQAARLASAEAAAEAALSSRHNDSR